MKKVDLKEKILNLETELEFLKKAILKEPNFKVDEENWKELKSESKKIRKKLYRKYYGRK